MVLIDFIPCRPYLGNEGFTDNVEANLSVQEAYVGVVLIVVDAGLNLYLVCRLFEECHRSGCVLEGTFLREHYRQLWPYTPFSCYIIFQNGK